MNRYSDNELNAFGGCLWMLLIFGGFPVLLVTTNLSFIGVAAITALACIAVGVLVQKMKA